ncbi:MAG: UDP-N-acetylmuramoyl-L-alanine--D-glutamate ligase [Actinobacteria bacterium]|nr:UDP-N-acetylmuramoyl-L-alanine--D-glutamate ligase [Actinomycetota bacterium]
MKRALVYGLGVAGESTARALLRRGVEVIAADDDVTPERLALAAELKIDLVERPGERDLEMLIRSSDVVSPAPGVPETHDVITTSLERGVALMSEIELAYRWEQQRPGGPRPMLAVTGTDGKTTTTLLTVEILRAAGLRSVDAGNTSTPLVDAIELDLDVFVVECTSFRLAWTPTFRAEAAVWLNLAPDHLNWHRSMATYEAAKARVFVNQRADDCAIGFVDDNTVMSQVEVAPGRHVSFGLNGADYFLKADLDTERAGGGGVLTGPAGTIAPTSVMRRSLPHDITNALAASALVMESELAGPDAIANALASFTGPPHRLENIGTWGEVAWFNDSKATTPHAAAAAIHSFDHIVLIAGGYDKGVDLASMAIEADRVDSVVALGATAPAVVAAFGSVAEVHIVDDIPAAVDRARDIARPGSTVLLSPGCASFDQYKSFDRRGDHFRSLVLAAHADSRPDHSVQQNISASPTPGGSS